MQAGKILKASLGLLLLGAGSAQAMDLQAFYASLSGPERNVLFANAEGSILLGISTFQKTEGNVICRKQGALVPRPTYRYACYVDVTAADSAAVYRDLPGQELTVRLNPAEPGKETLEKSGPGLICQMVAEGGEVKCRCFARIQQ